MSFFITDDDGWVGIVRIRLFQDSDSSEITDLFHGAVHAIPTSFYSSDELEAWSPTPPDYPYWKKRLALTKPFVAVDSAGIVGFIELNEGGYIDCLYVHQDQQGKGVATKLLAHLCAVARDRGFSMLSVQASKVAVPFFQQNGFQLGDQNRVILRGQCLVNYTMTFSLKSK